MAGLKEGQVINTADFKTVKILRASKDKVELGRGGQGIVYKVAYDGKEMALKWYFKSKMKNPQMFYNNIKNNISIGRPGFLTLPDTCWRKLILPVKKRL